MAKKEKLSTPAWILEGYDSPAEYNKAKGIDAPVKTSKAKPKKVSNSKSNKVFKVRRCPKCDSDKVGVVVGEDAKGFWGCEKCNWKGKDIKIDELNEDEFMKYLDEKGEDVS